MEPLARRPPVHRRTGPTVKILSIVVIGWWLLLAGAIIWVMPEPEASARPTPTSTLIGQTALIHRSGLARWEIPVERAALDTSRGSTTAQAAIRPGWIMATDSHLVRVVAVDGEAVQVEPLNGASVGERGWAKQRDLGPVDEHQTRYPRAAPCRLPMAYHAAGLLRLVSVM